MSEKVAEHFTKDDFTCNCGCETRHISASLVRTLEFLRKKVKEEVGFECPCFVNCSIRCESHNREVGGKKYSRHLPLYFEKGEGAADIYFGGITNKQARKIVKKLWRNKDLNGGLGLYKNFIHLDTSRRRKWGKFWKPKNDTFV